MTNPNPDPPLVSFQHARCRVTEHPTLWPGPLGELGENCTTADPCFEEDTAAVLADPETWRCSSLKTGD